MKLLTESNPKVQKGTAYGYLTAILHFAPSRLSGVMNACAWATEGCIRSCLNKAGRGGIIRKGEDTNAIQRARIARTRFFADLLCAISFLPFIEGAFITPLTRECQIEKASPVLLESVNIIVFDFGEIDDSESQSAGKPSKRP